MTSRRIGCPPHELGADKRTCSKCGVLAPAALTQFLVPTSELYEPLPVEASVEGSWAWVAFGIAVALTGLAAVVVLCV